MRFDTKKIMGDILRSLGHQGKIRTRDFKGAITLLKRTQRLDKPQGMWWVRGERWCVAFRFLWNLRVFETNIIVHYKRDERCWVYIYIYIFWSILMYAALHIMFARIVSSLELVVRWSCISICILRASVIPNQVVQGNKLVVGFAAVGTIYKAFSG